ncbi:8774_t:CDS:1, partial [Paraglomus occultum]
MGDSPLYIFKSFGPFWLVQEETFTGHESSSRSVSRRSSVHVIDGIDGSNVIDNIAGEESIIPPLDP